MRLGSLFSGYGGLDLAVAHAFTNVTTAWVSDIEPGPRAILKARFPDAPNLGDITQVDWANVEPVDIIAGGSPCQDLSTAGQRAGMRPGTRSGLWESMAHAIDKLRPSLVVWENVRGALSAPAFSLMESREGRVGDGSDGPVLRALGRVLGDLTNLGYDAQWTAFRASDMGAPHRRERVFVVAHPRGGGLRADRTQWAGPEHAAPISDGPLLPTPQARDGNGVPGDGFNLASLPREIALLPTPKAGDADFGLPRTSGRPPEKSTHLATRIAYTDWGKYAPAIHRWENILGRPAPAPTQPSRTGKPQLSPTFVEWMMGLPQGWVTDVGISRANQLRALGNGVVPQQAAAAIQALLRAEE